MLRKFSSAVYRGFFWIYERGTWQYDVMVILILAFIFLSPRHWFHDRPRVSGSNPEIVLLRNDPAQKVYELPATLMDAKADGSLTRSAERVLQVYTGRRVQILRIEPEDVDTDGQVMSYAVWVDQDRE